MQHRNGATLRNVATRNAFVGGATTTDSQWMLRVCYLFAKQMRLSSSAWMDALSLSLSVLHKSLPEALEAPSLCWPAKLLSKLLSFTKKSTKRRLCVLFGRPLTRWRDNLAHCPSRKSTVCLLFAGRTRLANSRPAIASKQSPLSVISAPACVCVCVRPINHGRLKNATGDQMELLFIHFLNWSLLLIIQFSSAGNCWL